ncbi:MAG: acyl carrier protein [Anaerolineae bacterium]|nr:acyl carrier protein [Anaerolineae bacterium]
MNQMLLMKVRSVIAQHFNVDAEMITPKAHFRETLAADSLDFVELMMMIARHLELGDVVDEEMRQIETVEQLLSYLETQHSY